MRHCCPARRTPGRPELHHVDLSLLKSFHRWPLQPCARPKRRRRVTNIQRSGIVILGTGGLCYQTQQQQQSKICSHGYTSALRDRRRHITSYPVILRTYIKEPRCARIKKGPALQGRAFINKGKIKAEDREY